MTEKQQEKLRVRIEAGDFYAAYLLGKYLVAPVRRPTKATLQVGRKLLVRAASGGVAAAAFEMGLGFDDGGFGSKPGQANAWYLKAAKGGHAPAWNSLARSFDYTRASARSLAKAMEYYRRGAELGDVLAQFNLAKSYEDGVIVSRSLAKAIRWYRAAAAQNYKEAKYRLRLLT